MEPAKLLLNFTAWPFGLPVSFLGVVWNMDNWKANVIFILAGLFWLVKLLILVRKDIDRSKRERQDRRRTDIELKELTGKK